jgi:hypothetical protein
LFWTKPATISDQHSAGRPAHLPTVHTLVHSASLSNRNHGRPAGFVSPAAAACFLANRRSFRWSIVAIKYRSASVA